MVDGCKKQGKTFLANLKKKLIIIEQLIVIRNSPLRRFVSEDVVADWRMDCFEHTCMQSSMVEKLFKLPPQPLYVNDTHRRA
ncbi:hypothetical protein T07_2048 [Trichinella nelsoni]|uniref:Uncharacterized protein n=1 Tax=Trichinella nelsoni TaxID=6336 RepID=A0A0V0RRP9_9BILA|nr:hypothetical protein T07_2048 [Trichinella nelsoni]